MERQIYLKMKSLDEARGIWFANFPTTLRTMPEEIPVQQALGRVTAEAVYARWSYPSFHSAAMDGIATRAELTFGASEKTPKFLRIGSDAIWINTGQPLPQGYDSVVMVEKLHVVGDLAEIRSPAYPWQHVRKIGEDVVASELLLTIDHRITPYDLGVLAGCGVFWVKVWKRPKVAIIPTGSELIEIGLLKGEPPPPPKVVESNSLVLKALADQAGADSVVLPVVEDSLEALINALDGALEKGFDIIMINAGSSAGSLDYTVHAIRASGEVLVHGVAMMPGKPTILGKVKGKAVVGVPGYPVSAVLSFNHFVRPLIYSLQGQVEPRSNQVKVRVTRQIPSRPGMDEFVRVNIGKVSKSGPYVAIPLPRAAGSLTSLMRAEGIIRIERHIEGILAEEEAETELLVGPEEIEETLVIIGSHDISIDILADELKRAGHKFRVISSNVGSLGGLMALRKGYCHMAGSHLLDPVTGIYNKAYVEKYLKDRGVLVLNLVKREQGFIVQRGNPKKIYKITDLTRPDVTFVNRQAGSGTRVLLDYELSKAGLDPSTIKGYDTEEFTHMAVAVDVKSGVADCGLGILAAARALDLDFVNLAQEQFDLVLLKEHLDHPCVKAALEVIGSKSFRDRVQALGGYDAGAAGRVFFEQ